MPFGPIFGALFFGLICGWSGLSLLAHPSGAGRLAGVSLLFVGVSLATGLLLRRPWARWAGVAVAVMLGLLALRMAALEGRLLDYVVLFSAIATAVLLALPATGSEGTASRREPPTMRRDLLQVSTALGIVGLLGAAWWGAAAGRPDLSQQQTALPTSALVQRVRWQDFDSGLEAARAEGRPVLATFVTDWCPYCVKMDRNTWRDPAVLERVSGLIPVRVDAEQRQALAMRYQVTGFPANFLLDADGEVISRSDGYLTARQLLSWIERSVGGTTAPGSRAALQRTPES